MRIGPEIIPADDYDEWDFWLVDVAKCPWCKSDVYTEDCHDAELEINECGECGNEFTLTAEHHISWTTKRAGNE